MNAVLRVMTFNLRGFYNRDLLNTWPEREALVNETILRCAPDVIGFQEANGRNVEALARHLQSYHYLAWPPYNNSAPHQFPAIFWNPRKLQPFECDTLWLSETPDDYSGSWDTDCIRSAAWIRFLCDGGGTVTLLNTHLDHISEQARVEGAKLIIERLDAVQSDGSAAIVTGDFNAGVSTPTYRLFGDAGFIDAHLAAGGSDGDPLQSFTYHGFEGRAFRGSDAPPRRIDWIIARDGSSTRLRAASCEIVRDEQPPVYPSDHYPVVALFAVEA